jgi:lysophospholipase L1-like esterase
MTWLLQALLLGCTVLLALWVRLPPAALSGFGLMAVALISSSLPPRFARIRGEGTVLALVWIGSVTAWASVLGRIEWDSFYAIPDGLIAAAIWLTARRKESEIWKGRWNAAVLAWLQCGALLWLGGGYFQNQRGDFYAGLLATLVVLVLCRLWFRLGAVCAQAVNTFILLLVALPALDLALRLQPHNEVRPETCQLFYSYDAAKGDPVAFMRWTEFFTSQADRLKRDIYTKDPNSVLPFRLRPGSHGVLISCPISINSLGFRGPEISVAKKGVYRIVALGESTTFGVTIRPEDKPWPEVVEQIIRQRLKTRRPVQVINAGVPAYTIEQNLYRLPREILPLQPDMIISYHGGNGFNLIDESVLPPLGPASPLYQERPLKLAADAEHRLRMLLFQYRARLQISPTKRPAAQPLETKYAAAYRQLIQCARTNGIRLVLANYSMAVNQASDQKIIDFYKCGVARDVPAFIRANPVHSLIVSRLAAENPEVCFVDTHPHLDGEHEKFIDLVHFTGKGDRQMAENIFAGISNTLQQDLATP